MTEERALTYRRLGPDTIASLQDCIRRVYGETYPFHWFYDGSSVERLLDEERLVTIIALDDSERVVGTMGMLLASPRNREGDYSAHSIAAMVDEAHRGRDVLMRLGAELFRASEHYALAGLHLYALALHDVVQRHSMEKGAAAITGILPAYFNRDVRVAGFATGGHRIGAVALFQPLFRVAPERSIYLPAPYRDVLRGVYDRLPLFRRFADAAAESRDWYRLPARSQCELSTEPLNHEAKLEVRRVGEDLAERLAALKREKTERELRVLYVDLALDDSAIDAGVETANGAGFCFGALVPERSHTDWLRLQHFEPEDVSLESMVVATDAGKELLRFVRHDKERLEGAGPLLPEN
jgi:hypothetical protein